MNGLPGRKMSDDALNARASIGIGNGNPKLNRREKEFFNVYFANRECIRPGFFPLDHDGFTKYFPDFYDPERDVYIEVAGTHQAYNSNRDKYKTFQSQYDDLNFEFRRHTVELLEFHKSGRVKWKTEPPPTTEWDLMNDFDKQEFLSSLSQKGLSVGDRISIIRTKKKLTQDEVAKRSYLSPVTVNRIENGHQVPTRPTIKCIADALGVPIDEFSG